MHIGNLQHVDQIPSCKEKSRGENPTNIFIKMKV